MEFRPTGTVTRTPVDPGQLVPGDPTGLTQAAAALTEWAATAPTGLSSLALEASAAHARLGQRLAEQRAEAEALFSRVQAEGVPADVICNASWPPGPQQCEWPGLTCRMISLMISPGFVKNWTLRTGDEIISGVPCIS